MKRLVINLGLGSCLSFSAFAMNCNVDLGLENFHKDPKKFMNAPVLKLDENCRPVKAATLFSKEDIQGNKFVELKDKFRKSLCHYDQKSKQKVCLKDLSSGANVIRGRAPIQSLDLASNLVSNGVEVTSILEMNSKGLQSGKVSKMPWSDWYWPIAYGQLSYRYAEPNMVEALNNSGLRANLYWPFLNDWHNNNKPFMVDVNNLSPAEKYDVLVGDSNFSLTKSMLSVGRGYYDREDKVETWMGICHGWAPASYMLPRPDSSIRVTAVDGETEILFRPSDLKALGSQLWASGIQYNKFMGGRCNKKEPATDSNGRILDQECFDTNPGAWHKALINQVGVNKKSFVMDATFDYEVWNFPIVSYSYNYINPRSMQQFRKIRKNVVKVKNFRNDKFKAYRSPEAVYVVGVKMEVRYAVETNPTTRSYDDESYDSYNTAYYTYDLELDANYNIVGGEWYQNKHPDFLWTPYDDGRATSVVDDYLGEIDLDNLGNSRIKEMAPLASDRMQPIGKLVEALLQKSHNN